MSRGPIDVLYILGTGSRWENNELRYSLRSLEKYALNVGRVFVTGEDPGFLSREVIFTPCNDPGPRAFNHIHKVRTTIEKTDISERFLLNYDDNFFTAPVDVSAYPFFYKGVLPDRTETHRSYRYSLIEARRFLEAHGKPILNFSVHCPCVYEREKFLALREAWEIGARSPHGIAVRAVYCNWYGFEAEFMRDCKLKTVKTREEASLAIADRHVFSIHDDSLPNGVAGMLREMYPRPSRWEVPAE